MLMLTLMLMESAESTQLNSSTFTIFTSTRSKLKYVYCITRRFPAIDHCFAWTYESISLSNLEVQKEVAPAAPSRLSYDMSIYYFYKYCIPYTSGRQKWRRDKNGETEKMVFENWPKKLGTEGSHHSQGPFLHSFTLK